MTKDDKNSNYNSETSDDGSKRSEIDKSTKKTTKNTIKKTHGVINGYKLVSE